MNTDRLLLTLVCTLLCLTVGGQAAHAQKPGVTRPANKTWGDRVPISYKQLQSAFANPPMAYAPFMFWFWDTPLTPEAKAMAAEMAEKVSQQRINPGYPFAIPVSTGAMPPEQWLSKDWFEALDGALKPTEKAGTYMGFCDEYGFPSGQAAGRVLAQNPELKAMSLEWKIQDAVGGTCVDLPESFFTVAARVVKRTAAATLPAPLIGHWIWHPTAIGNNQATYFRTRLVVDPAKKIKYLDINLTADDSWTLFVNGQQVASDSFWQRISQYDLRPYVHPGVNTIAIKAYNIASPSGMTAAIHTTFADGTQNHQYTGADWACSSTLEEDWSEPTFDDGNWVKPAVVGDAGSAPWNMRPYQADRTVQIDASSLKVIGEGKPFKWTAPDGDWRIYTFTKYHNPWQGSPVDYLNERLPDIFMEIAYKPYLEHFGNRLGKTLIGSFRDNEGGYGYKLAWSDSLASRYKKDKGQDIRRMMPLMIDDDTAGKWAKARWDWFDTVSNIYAESYWQKNTDWLRKHGLYCTAHTWEETLMLQASAVGDHFRFQRALSMQGVDSLQQNFLSPHDFKEAQSVSEFENRRFMSETMSVSGWDASPTLMKRAVNNTTAWGVSQFVAIINLLSRNINALGWPPDGYTENPYFPYMHQWGDFSRRASYITAHGHTVPDVLLLNPMDSLWVLSGDGLLDAKSPQDLLLINNNFGTDVLRMDNVYRDAMTELTDGRVEFLCADNYYLRKLKLKSNRLVVGEFAFRSIVMPPMLVMPLDVASKLVAFAKAGGHVYSLGSLPSCSTENGANDPKMIKAMSTLRSMPSFVTCHAGLKPEISKPDGGLSSAVTFLSGEFPMIQQHRRIDGRDFFWLVNNSDTERKCRMVVRGVKGAAAIWDCENGQIRAVASNDSPKGSELALTFKANEAFWLVFDPQKPVAKSANTKPHQVTTKPLNGPWTWRIDTNTQPPVPNPVSLPAELVSAAGVVRELKSWNMCSLGAFSGYVDYTTEFVVDSVKQPVRLDLGHVQHLAEVWVNGRSVGSRLWAPYEYELGDAVRAGTNTLRVRVGNLVANNMGVAAESGLFGPVVQR